MLNFSVGEKRAEWGWSVVLNRVMGLGSQANIWGRAFKAEGKEQRPKGKSLPVRFEQQEENEAGSRWKKEGKHQRCDWSEGKL